MLWSMYNKFLFSYLKKTAGLFGVVAELMQAAVDTGTQWLQDLCNE